MSFDGDIKKKDSDIFYLNRSYFGSLNLDFEVPKRPEKDVEGLKDDEVSDSLLRTGIPVRRDGRPGDDPNMPPIRANGIFTDIGEYRKLLKADGLIKGFSSKYTSDIKSAQLSLFRYINMTKEEEKAFNLIANIFGESNEDDDMCLRPVLRGGLRRLLGIADKSREYGFSIIEYSWGTAVIDGEAFVVPTNYGVRRASSINRVFYDENDNPIAVEQILQKDPLLDKNHNPKAVERHVDKKEKFVVIPLEKCIVWSFDSEEGEFEGNSQLRAAYGWHKAKMNAVKKYLHQQGRLADGVTLIEEQGTREGVYAEISQRDVEGLASMLERFYNGESNYLLSPFGVKLSHHYPALKMSPPTDLLAYCDAQILMSMGAFLFGFGSLASSSSAFDGVYDMMREQMKDIIEDYVSVINDWIVKIIDKNMKVPEGFRYPKYQLASFTLRSLDKTVSIMTRAAQFLLFTFQPEDEARFRRMAGMVNFSVEEIKKARAEMKEKAGQMSQQGSQSSQAGQASPESLRSGGKDKKDKDKKDDKDSE